MLIVENEINEAGSIHARALPEKDEYIGVLLSRISLLEKEAEDWRSVQRAVVWVGDRIRKLVAFRR